MTSDSNHSKALQNEHQGLSGSSDPEYDNPLADQKEFSAGKDDRSVCGEERSSDSGSSTSVKEVFDIQQIDPVLAKKMALVNQAIDEIGMTSFQWKMFFLNGFGYAVDSVSCMIFLGLISIPQR